MTMCFQVQLLHSNGNVDQCHPDLTVTHNALSPIHHKQSSHCMQEYLAGTRFCSFVKKVFHGLNMADSFAFLMHIWKNVFSSYYTF